MTHQYVLPVVFLRPSRRIRLLAFLSFFVTATWTFITRSSIACSQEKDIAREYPLVYRHIHSFNGTGGGKSDIPTWHTPKNARNANTETKHGISLHIGLILNNRKIFSTLLV